MNRRVTIGYKEIIERLEKGETIKFIGVMSCKYIIGGKTIPYRTWRLLWDKKVVVRIGKDANGDTIYKYATGVR
jgi:hypothetical protein